MWQGNDFWKERLTADKDRFILMAQSPSVLFMYWDWTPAKTKLFNTNFLLPTITIKLFYADTNTLAHEISLRWDELRCYHNHNDHGRTMYAVLFVSTGRNYQSLLRSNQVILPRGEPVDGEWDLPSSDSYMRHR